MNKKTKTIIWIVVAVLVVGLVGILLSDIIGSARDVSFSEFMAYLQKGEIHKLYIDAYNWTGYALDSNGNLVPVLATVAPSVYDFSSLTALLESLNNPQVIANLAIEFTDPNAGSIWSSLIPLFGVVLVALMFWLIMRNAAGGNNPTMSIGKTACLQCRKQMPHVQRTAGRGGKACNRRTHQY